MTRLLLRSGPHTLTKPITATTTVTVRNSLGVAIDTEEVEPVEGVGTYELPNITVLDILTVTWDTAGVHQVDTVDVVADRLFGIEDARNMRLRGLKDATKFTDDAIEAQRVTIEDDFETICGRSFIRRHRLEQHTADGGPHLWLERTHITVLRAITVDGQAVNPDTVTFTPTGRLTRPDGWYGTVDVAYDHGTPPPGAVTDAATILAISKLAGSDAADRTIVATDDTGTYRLSQPDGRGRPTGLPQVDSVLARYGAAAPLL